MTTPIAGQLPGFTWSGCLAPEMQAAAISWNPESLRALSGVPEVYIQWANKGSRVTTGLFEARTPQQLLSSLQYKDFDGTRPLESVTIAAPIVKTQPKTLNFGWPMIIGHANGAVNIADYYGLGDVTAACIGGAQVHKAELAGRAVENGIGAGAMIRTVPQPGLPTGLPLFSDATTGLHYANSKNGRSRRFPNLFRNVGDLDAGGPVDNFQLTLDHMLAVPHASYDALPMGCDVRHFIGPTWMRQTFFKLFVANLILRTGTGAAAGSVAAVSNVNAAALREQFNSANFIGVGVGPIQFWLAPFLDTLPYFTANGGAKAGEQMWLTVDDSPGRPPWLEFVSPSKDMVPTARLFGDQDPQSVAEMRCRLLTDLHVGYGAGQPHAAQIHWSGAGP